MDKSQKEKQLRWDLFNQAWSEEDSEQRMELLKEALNAHCVYSDQFASVEGLESISHYIEGFQKSVPGAKFETFWYKLQSYQCLSAWKLVGANGKVLKTGHGYGRYVNHHRLLVITYFIDSEVT